MVVDAEPKLTTNKRAIEWRATRRRRPLSETVKKPLPRDDPEKAEAEVVLDGDTSKLEL